jgi:hypothetical protein
MPEMRKAEAQQILDQLMEGGLIPFELTVGKITNTSDECEIHFYDARIRSVKFSWKQGYPFRKYSGPLSWAVWPG